ncbi:hypothetical protein OC842_004719 [Tilletia horrida]|uniref:Ubiquitin 3 binding protein But2 C-terminal domain-containing protein n=1 Tax=Tilletia horrida TaxID=155126 RepID=A0AAN6JJT6_9BASI|nr:hypothetical protein OC842_004719 [Tilletia horrida]
MLANTLLAVAASALALGAIPALAGPVLAERETNIKCGKPLTHAVLTQTGPSGVRRPAEFQGAKDSKGRLQLSTSLNGQAASGKYEFEFVPCNSTVLPSGTKYYADSYLEQYGQIRLKADRTQCLTATRLNNADAPAALVRAPCQQVDNSGLNAQWFSATYSSPGSTTSYDVHLVGNGQRGGPKGYYTFKNVAKGGARLVETLFVPGSSRDSNAEYPYADEEYTVQFLTPPQ